MLRRARLSLAGIPLHIIQRGNNRQACFFTDRDYQCYSGGLGEYADRANCGVHTYVLMTNHVQLLISADRAEAPGRLMKALGQRYVQYVNRTYRRSGTLWEGRFRLPDWWMISGGRPTVTARSVTNALQRRCHWRLEGVWPPENPGDHGKRRNWNAECCLHIGETTVVYPLFRPP